MIPQNGEIVSETGAIETGKLTENLCFSLDIGTTTLALALVSLDEGKIIKVITHTNPQCTFGADVMTRIDYCRKKGLLPKELINKCIAIKNSSLLGTVKYACEKNDLAIYIDNSTCVDLSANPTFSDLFIENMMFEV